MRKGPGLLDIDCPIAATELKTVHSEGKCITRSQENGFDNKNSS